MSQQKLDQREVDKIRAALARDGPGQAAVRFDENSPEFHKAMQQRRKKRQYAGSQQRRILTETSQEGSTMADQDDQQNKQTPAQQRRAATRQQSPAQERAAQGQRTSAQQRVIARQRQQARRVGWEDEPMAAYPHMIFASEKAELTKERLAEVATSVLDGATSEISALKVVVTREVVLDRVDPTIVRRRAA